MSSDDRTQAPSRRRRQQAREAGQIAHSPELTAAAGLLAIVVMLGFWGNDLTRGLVDLIQSPFVVGAATIEPGRLTPDAVASLVREAAWHVLLPMLGLIVGTALAILAMHQVQVGFLWVPGLLAPDPARLFQGWSRAADLNAATGRVIWALLKTAVVIGVAAWSLGKKLGAFNGLAELESPALVDALGSLAGSLLQHLALALAALGVIDFVLRWRKQESMLQMTAEEGRQEQRDEDGDPEARARRRALARSWRNDPMELLPGSALMLTGPPGLAVLLAGGPPPEKPITVRRVARGREAFDLRRAAEAAGVPCADAAECATHLAQGRVAAGSLPPELARLLAALWPNEGAGAAG